MTSPQAGPDGRRTPGPRPALRLVAVGRFFGVPIYFAPSWLIIAALLTVYYEPVIDSAVPSLSGSTSYLVSLGFAVLFALCVVAHELGHTAVSLALGHPVRRVVIFLLGGVSEIERDPDRPRDEFLITAAGPAVSALICVVSGVLVRQTGYHSVPGIVLFLLFWSNLVVVVFNLLPGLPLDGGRMLRAGVWAAGAGRFRATRVAASAGLGTAVLVGVAGLWLAGSTRSIASFVLSAALTAYLWVSARQSLRLNELMRRAHDVDVRSLLRPGLMVGPDVSVAEALRRVWEGTARGLVVTDADDRPRAIVDETRIAAVPPDRRAWTSLDTVSRPLSDGLVLSADLRGEGLLDAIRAHPAAEYLVVEDDGSPAGILSVVDLARRLETAPGGAAALAGPSR